MEDMVKLQKGTQVEWIDADLHEKLEALADKPEGAVGPEAQQKMLELCSCDPGALRQLNVWLVLGRMTPLRDIRLDIKRGASPEKLKVLSSAAASERRRHSPLHESISRMTKVN